MQKIAALIVLALCTATLVYAQDVVTINSKNGDVSFNHKAHSSSNDCKTCHGEGTPGKMKLDKDSAHKLCKGCHETKKSGPVECNECHRKK